MYTLCPSTDNICHYRSPAGQPWTLLERYNIDNATFIKVPFPKHNSKFPIHSFFRAVFPKTEEATSDQTLEPVSFLWGRVDDRSVTDYLSKNGDTSLSACPIPVSDQSVVGARYMMNSRGLFDHAKGRSCYVLGRGTNSDRQYTAFAARGIHDSEISAFCRILMQEGVSADTNRNVCPKHCLASPEHP